MPMSDDPSPVPASPSALSFSPLYRQIKALMIKSLEAGEWQPGDAIPSEAELALRFNVSQGTARKAIDEMAAENLLIRRQGKGTFVATHSDPRSFFRFLRLAPDDGVLSSYRGDALSCVIEPAQEKVASALGIKPGDPVVVVERVLRFDGEPVVLDRLCLLVEFFQDLSLERLKSCERSLYSFFESAFGVRMIRAEEQLHAVAADARTAGILGVETGSPLLRVERVAYTYGNKPVEWRCGYYSTQRHHYFNELS